ncbi:MULTISPECIES: hypothetical protein [Acetobacter]|uniref:Bacteriophage protein n=1 Tax=Acetobacter thailandicus TaxID=1502842 RepID=A0ABT3QDG4_9PROT|nr:MULTISPECIES: hypothetical protein [Acetobacter]MBS1003171.1 hypothetical protein [Acetobacter thailandicus]MCX2563310.1 hypothetical protein [Acetobacter thailandicus]NHN94064.1 hypothetical protein [Acetobacter thailandicus]OUJ08379.1 hypothetical protein HK25_13210 [Acetobacter sp. DsW_059]
MTTGGKADVTVTRDKARAVLKTIRDLTNQRVLVGIPEDENERPEGDAGNALIGYVLETGAPERNLPPRPFLVPGVEKVVDKSLERLRTAGKQAMEGVAGAVNIQLNAIGLEASASVKDKMDTGPFEPLADATLRNRISRGGGAQAGAREELANREAGNPPGTDLAQPLIDTGNLQNSVTYVIRDARNRI